ncbi:hypothetical protein ETU08_09070 [Apibacter muscae]|nr:hypothetical protein ETU08_09070 [Apibacter muscae]
MIEISKGTELYHYTKVNSEGISYRGDYYTANLNHTPNELGISDKYNVREGRNYTDEIKTVNQEKIIIKQEVEGLKSTSAPINDTWS